MSEIGVIDNVSMAQLRVLSVVGLLATAVITTLLSLILAAGGAALARRVRHALDRSRGIAHGSTPRPAPPRYEVLEPNEECQVRAPQAARSGASGPDRSEVVTCGMPDSSGTPFTYAA